MVMYIVSTKEDLILTSISLTVAFLLSTIFIVTIFTLASLYGFSNPYIHNFFIGILLFLIGIMMLIGGWIIVDTFVGKFLIIAFCIKINKMERVSLAECRDTLRKHVQKDVKDYASLKECNLKITDISKAKRSLQKDMHELKVRQKALIMNVPRYIKYLYQFWLKSGFIVFQKNSVTFA